MLWRPVGGEELRCGTQHMRRLVERTGDQVAGLDLVHAYSNVDAALDEAADLVGEIDDDLQPGMLGREIRERRTDDELAKRDRHLELQHAAQHWLRAAKSCLGLTDLGQDRLAAFVVVGSLLGDANMPGGALHEYDTKPGLQLAQQRGDRCVGHVELGCGARQAAGLDDLNKDLHRTQSIHPCLRIRRSANLPSMCDFSQMMKSLLGSTAQYRGRQRHY